MCDIVRELGDAIGDKVGRVDHADKGRPGGIVGNQMIISRIVGEIGKPLGPAQGRAGRKGPEQVTVKPGGQKFLMDCVRERMGVDGECWKFSIEYPVGEKSPAI